MFHQLGNKLTSPSYFISSHLLETWPRFLSVVFRAISPSEPCCFDPTLRAIAWVRAPLVRGLSTNLCLSLPSLAAFIHPPRSRHSAYTKTTLALQPGTESRELVLRQTPQDPRRAKRFIEGSQRPHYLATRARCIIYH